MYLRRPILTIIQSSSLKWLEYEYIIDLHSFIRNVLLNFVGFVWLKWFYL